MNFAIKLYRLLARAFPHEFKVVYGADVIQLGEDIVEDIAKRNGATGLARMIGDLMVRIPAEYAAELRRDIAYGARTLIKSPGFAAVGIISLALGIAVTTTIFSEIHMLIFRDLPVAKDPQQLALAQGVSYPYFEEYRAQKNVVSSAGAFIASVAFGVTLDPAVNSHGERVFGHIVSPEYFSVLGVTAARGRVFSPAADKPGDPAVAVISDRFWHERLNSDPNAVGRTFKLNGQTATIVGITPKDFLGVMPIVPADIFIPTTISPRVAPELGDDILHKRDTKAFSVIMRLAPGVTMASAESAIDTLTKHLNESNVNADRNQKGRIVKLLPGGLILPIPPEAKPIMYGLWGTLMVLLLGIACMNLANMLLAKAGARRREIAIRLAVGASRFRLIRQLVTESVILGLGGGLVGMALAYWMTTSVSAMKLPGAVPFQFDIRPDWQVLAFTILLSIVTGIGFGLAPAFAATKADVAPTLKEGGVAQMRGYNRFGMRNLLVVGQVAGSLMLLLVTGFMVLGFGALATGNANFDTRTMYLISLDPVRDGYSAEQASAFLEKLPERLRNVTAVEGVALAAAAPFEQQMASADFQMQDQTAAIKALARVPVGPAYFQTLNERMLAGREFTDRDTRAEPAAATPAILNESAARELTGSLDAVGRRITRNSQAYEVIGVVRDLKGPAITPGGIGTMYLPLTKQALAHPGVTGLTLMVRARAGSDALEGIRREIAALDPNITMFNTRTLYQALDEMAAYIRIGTFFYGGMGLFALILASIGLAGVTAYAVTQRRKEIGIRMALGAKKSQVLGLVLREGTVLVLIGSILGFMGAAGLAKGLAAFVTAFAQVFHMATTDPKLIIGAPALLAALAMFACYWPARRSAQIDPLKALREE